MTQGAEEEQKSFFARGALLGLVGGAVVALLLISVVGSVASMVDDLTGSPSAAPDTGPTTPVDPLVAEGESAANSNGCLACHTVDGSDSVGPTWQGLSASVDADYVRTAILDPNAVIAEGFTEGLMPITYADTLSPEDVDALIAYILSL